MTFFVKNDGPAIAQLPKCGTQTIGRALLGPRELTNDAAMKLDVRVAFIRNPFDRLASAFSFFATLLKQGNHTEASVMTNAKDYPTFIDWALESDDIHVVPQYESLLTDAGQFVPNRLHKLTQMESVWASYYPVPEGEFPHRNSSERLAVTDYRADDIRARYAKDLELWHQS